MNTIHLQKTTHYVEEIILKYDWYLKDFLVSLDKEAFENAILAVDITEYDFDEIIPVDVAPKNVVVIDACVTDTVHHLKLKFNNAPEDFYLSVENRKSIVLFVKGETLHTCSLIQLL